MFVLDPKDFRFTGFILDFVRDRLSALPVEMIPASRSAATSECRVSLGIVERTAEGTMGKLAGEFGTFS